MDTKVIQFSRFWLSGAYTRRRTRARVYNARVVVRVFFVAVLSWLVLSLSTGSVQALSAVQGYKTTETDLTPGLVVALVDDSTGSTAGYVAKATQANASRIIGVVVNPDSSELSVASSGSQVYVATSGVAQVYVTDINGIPKAGDLLVTSPLAGILMKADNASKTSGLGVALENFPTSGTQTTSVNSVVVGRQLTAHVGLVRINMDIKVAANGQNPNSNWLQSLGSAIVGHQISTSQAVIALSILVMLVIIEGGILYAAVSSSIISLGRNPFAKKTIMRGLLHVVLLVGAVLILGVGAMYLVLWL